MGKPSFEWEERKDAQNQAKHGIPFALAQHAFADQKRVIAEDAAHSAKEQVLLLGTCRSWCTHRPLHIPLGCHTHFWHRLLAQRQGHL